MLSADKLFNRDRLIGRLHRMSVIVAGHWLWSGKRTKAGYGEIQLGGKFKAKYVETHRLSASLFLELNLADTNSHALHKTTCPYKHCWNPDCLYVGTHADNMKDIVTLRTHCPAGHSYQVSGSKKRDGSRYCRECHRQRTIKTRKQKKQTQAELSKGESIMRAVLTPDDLKKGDLAEVGWHPAEIIDYKEEDADTDGSTNCIFQFKILDGPSKGIQPRKLFNEKALGFGKNLWKTLNFPFDAQKGYELSTELFKQTIGHKLKIYIKRGKSNRGNEFNEVADFMPLA